MKKFNIPARVYLPLLVIVVGTILPICLIGEMDPNVLFGIATYATMIFILALLIRYLIVRIEEKEKEEKEIETKKFDKKLIFNLNEKTVWLVDYENTNTLPKEFEQTDKNTVYYIFAGKLQSEQIRKELHLLSTKSLFDVIYIDKMGKNLLDIGLGMYVGTILATYKPKEIYICSNDKGYKSLIQIAEDFGYHNLFNVSPKETAIMREEDIMRLFKNIKSHSLETSMSLGNFKKRFKKSWTNISADEVNYAVKFLEKTNKITITEANGYKTVEFK